MIHHTHTKSFHPQGWISPAQTMVVRLSVPSNRVDPLQPLFRVAQTSGRELSVPSNRVEPLQQTLFSKPFSGFVLSVPSNRVEPLQRGMWFLLRGGEESFSTLKPGRTSATTSPSTTIFVLRGFSTLKPGRSSATHFIHCQERLQCCFSTLKPGRSSATVSASPTSLLKSIFQYPQTGSILCNSTRASGSSTRRSLSVPSNRVDPLQLGVGHI